MRCWNGSRPLYRMNRRGRTEGDGAYVTDLSRRLRLGDPPVVARIENDALLLDPRTVRSRQDSAVMSAVKVALGG